LLESSKDCLLAKRITHSAHKGFPHNSPIYQLYSVLNNPHLFSIIQHDLLETG
jgi:fructosamine-3-kinase